jgi:Cof subfamily protein (haloacid dehalogenase superfamily)
MPAATQRAVFIDVDGTLVDYRGRVPDSAREAIAAARKNGHKVLLCTGRSLSSIWTELHAVGWDGIIGAAGGYVQVGDTVVVQRHIPVDQVRHVVEFFDEHRVEYLLETTSGVYGSRGAPRRVREQMLWSVSDPDIRGELARSVASFMDRIELDEDLLRDDINKVVFLGGTDLSMERLREEFGEHFDLVPASVAGFGGELSIRGVHKAAGIEAALAHLGIDRADAVAFGDGFNDLEMLAYVGIGVAMGGAPPEVVAVADRVTGAPEDDGIAQGMAALGLI